MKRPPRGGLILYSAGTFTGSSDKGWAWLEKVFTDRWVSLERAHRAGVKICVGTDAGFWMYHGENATELEELVKGGLTAMEAEA